MGDKPAGRRKRRQARPLAAVLSLLMLSLPQASRPHGLGHGHGPAHGSADRPDALPASAVRRLNLSIQEEFQDFRLTHRYGPIDDPDKLPFSKRGLDFNGYLFELQNRDRSLQHYRHNLIEQAIKEGRKTISRPGYAGQKLAFLTGSYLLNGFGQKSALADAGIRFMKPAEKLLKNDIIAAVARLAPPRIDPAPGELAVDVHVHTLASFDGTSSLESLIMQAATSGLGAIAITDHDNFEESPQALAVAERLKTEGRIPPDFLIIPGEEVSSREGHILALFITSQIPTNLPAAEVINEIHRQGGIAIAPHPMEPLFGLGEKLVDILPLDGLVVTGATPSELYLSTRLAERNAHRLALFMDTDAHEEAAVGWTGYTLILTEDPTPAGVIAAIRAHRTRPVYRRMVQAFLDLGEGRTLRTVYKPLELIHAAKRRIETAVRQIIGAENVYIGVPLILGAGELWDGYGLFFEGTEKYTAGLPQKMAFSQITADFGRVRLRLHPRPGDGVHLAFKTAIFPPARGSGH